MALALIPVSSLGSVPFFEGAGCLLCYPILLSTLSFSGKDGVRFGALARRGAFLLHHTVFSEPPASNFTLSNPPKHHPSVTQPALNELCAPRHHYQWPSQHSVDQALCPSKGLISKFHLIQGGSASIPRNISQPGCDFGLSSKLLRRLRQEHREFKVCLDYRRRPTWAVYKNPDSNLKTQ